MFTEEDKAKKNLSNFIFEDYLFDIETGRGSVRISQTSNDESSHKPFSLVLQHTLTAPTKATISESQIQFGEIRVLLLDKRAIKVLCVWNRIQSRHCLAILIIRGRIEDYGTFKISLDYGEVKLINQLVEENLIPRRFLKILNYE